VIMDKSITTSTAHGAVGLNDKAVAAYWIVFKRPPV
jgi:hypothetical protein